MYKKEQFYFYDILKILKNCHTLDNTVVISLENQLGELDNDNKKVY